MAQEPDKELQEAQEALGIPPDTEEAPKDKPESDQEPEAESEEESEETEDDESEESDEDDKDDDDDDQDDRKAKKVPLALYKKEKGARKVAQNQLADKDKEIADLKGKLATLERPAADPVDQTVAAKAVSDKVREVAKRIAAKQNLNEEGLSEVIEETAKLVLELTSKEKAELPKDVQDKLKTLDELQAKMNEDAEKRHFEGEWGQMLPSLRKQFPNATEAQIAEAKKLMDDLSHSKEGADKELPYLLWKNSKKFTTILKVLAKDKSAESQTRGIPEDDGPEPDYLAPDMSPEKLASLEERESRKRITGSNGKIRFY